ncbi:ATP-dependent DNA helicase RecG [Moraxella macacae 0408225]|uniref:ATP-dependent DNA helicase RecG n=1 Tax=Moraxella macacae 0408225 TaxID=1230338 RepID=L2F8Z2_9GAMM|nr:ATP-dependent DNA helicase RecG [Moraxella macacae]ELA09529.1 ATP-dependent DNA helicase RecG [Moraxella macacae 0408225]
MQPTNVNVANHPITALSGVGVKIAEQLSGLGITRIFDLLLHLPRDYEDRSHLVNIADVVHGKSVLIQGKIIKSDSKRTGMSVILQDTTGQLTLRFFHVYRGLDMAMQVGNVLRVFGEIIINQYGTQIPHPEFEIITNQKPLANTSLMPIYPTVKGLHQNKLRSLIKQALQTIKQHQPNSLINLNNNEWQSIEKQLTTQFPQLTQLNNPFAAFGWLDALNFIHQPPIDIDLAKQYHMLEQLKNRSHLACQRLIIEEMLANQVGLLYRKQQLYQHQAVRCNTHSDLAKKLLANLPFTPTDAQNRVVNEIVQDLAKSTPMLRLVQGDVGAGKTLVAALAACYALDSGWQVAIMAPTELLAEQHFINFTNWFKPLGIGIGWLAGKQTTKERTLALQQIGNHEVQIAVGTHALFQDNVQFAKLGLVIIDEQHRFGVEQRMALLNKGLTHTTPHQLIMTATPIPRTLAMSAFGDMDTSIIDELPPNRTPITTVTISRDRRDEVIERIAVNCEQGKQAYWVCPLVEESTALDAQSAELTYADLHNRLNFNIGLVHGKMKSAQKQQAMQDFKAGKTALLVATTVIEVGVDVPNASLMVIENAERLGLSQLHQLRGRIGRGSQKSFCVLLYKTPLSEFGIERLNVLRDSSDGFVIAQKDLELRGAGELLGKRQAGFDNYYISDLARDEFLLVIAQNLAKHLLAQPDKKAVLHTLIEQWTPDAIKFINA